MLPPSRIFDTWWGDITEGQGSFDLCENLLASAALFPPIHNYPSTQKKSLCHWALIFKREGAVFFCNDGDHDQFLGTIVENAFSFAFKTLHFK